MAALVLFTLFIGIVYGGIMAYDRVVLANAVATGARTLATENGVPTACTDANNAIIAAAYGMQTSQITIPTYPMFIAQSGTGAGTSSCMLTTGTNPANGTSCSAAAPCQILNGQEYAVMAATYPCSMYFPRLGINLCSLPQGNTQITYPSGQTGNNQTTITVNCPYTYCVYSIEIARIEGTGPG